MPEVVIPLHSRLDVVAQDIKHLALGMRSVMDDLACVSSELKQAELTPSPKNVVAFAY